LKENVRPRWIIISMGQRVSKAEGELWHLREAVRALSTFIRMTNRGHQYSAGSFDRAGAIFAASSSFCISTLKSRGNRPHTKRENGNESRRSSGPIVEKYFPFFSTQMMKA